MTMCRSRHFVGLVAAVLLVGAASLVQAQNSKFLEHRRTGRLDDRRLDRLHHDLFAAARRSVRVGRDEWRESEPDPWEPGEQRNASLRMQLERIIRRVGVKAWLGNTAALAAKHYLQVTEADYDRAAGSGAESGAWLVQKPVQQAAALICMEGQATTQVPGLQGLVPNFATTCETVQSYPVPLAGLEPATAGLEIPCSIRLSYRGKLVACPLLSVVVSIFATVESRSESVTVPKTIPFWPLLSTRGLATVFGQFVGVQIHTRSPSSFRCFRAASAFAAPRVLPV